MNFESKGQGVDGRKRERKRIGVSKGRRDCQVSRKEGRNWTETVIGDVKREAGITINGGTQEFGEWNRRVKGGVEKHWRGPRETTREEEEAAQMAVGRQKEKGDSVTVKMRVGGGNLGGKKEEDRKRE